MSAVRSQLEGEVPHTSVSSELRRNVLNISSLLHHSQSQPDGPGRGSVRSSQQDAAAAPGVDVVYSVYYPSIFYCASVQYSAVLTVHLLTLVQNKTTS